MSGLTAEQRELRTVVRGLLEKESPEATVRAVMATDTGFDPELLAGLAGMGLPGLAVPEEQGGAGAGWVEQGVVFEELGRALACVPYLSTVGLAIPALLAAGDRSAIDRWLPGLASGERTATVALPEQAARWTTGGEALTATGAGPEWEVTGVAAHVLDGATAHLLLVVAVTDGGPTLFAVDPAHPGVQRTATTTSDHTRRFAHLEFRGAPAVPVGTVGAAGGVVGLALAHGRVALACEQVGGAARVLELAVEHARTRVQFARPIGSFQAVKHRCADMLVAVETARSAAWAAVRAVGTEELHLVSAVAAAVCADAYTTCASGFVQIAGGLGYTWEHSAHLYVKRSRGSAVLFGTPHQHRRLVADLASIREGRS
ncbi:acyl-CoA dehydrogenase family protein [Cryptosporangium aurantiacum]|uniref:Acyl-CoA dehydrogenase n=1 Tax=Cryptosporangium aurantiacum TaxID=134849 RepID=A0A1M7PNS6_9ACTN|nr:acyl-CoA dehydrogenase family protein [Cryptosporangium aurantiacum]SHN18755.1 acyl-CoA dehydrogenase [Cryptosporangium aurantiacum]